MGLMDVILNAKDMVIDKCNAFLHGEADFQNNYYGAEDAEEFAALQEEPAEQPQQDYMYAQQPQPQQGGWNGGYQPQHQAPQQGQWQQGYQQPMQTQAEAQPARPFGMSGRSAQAQQAQQDNVVAFPGTFQAANGKAYRHVERAAQLVSREACYDIIDIMKNGESVVVSIESIQSAQEVQHCVDLLSGAAYTLGCSITKLSAQSRIYLIAPNTVQVLLDEYTQKINAGRSASRTSRARTYAGQERQRSQYRQEAENQPAAPEQESRFARPSYPPRPNYRGPQQQEAYYDDNETYQDPQNAAYGQSAYGGY